MGSVDHMAASQMGNERTGQAAEGQTPHSWTEPEAADYLFLTLLLQALLKVLSAPHTESLETWACLHHVECWQTPGWLQDADRVTA